MVNIPSQYLKEHLQMHSASTLELALKALKAGVWEWIIDSDFVKWDERCYELFNIDPSLDVSINTLIDKVVPDQRNRIIELWNRIPDNKGWFEMEFQIEVEGEVRWIRLSGHFISAVNGDEPKASGVMVDITDEKSFNQKLNEANLTKDKFFSIIAHDLRSPFTSILGFSRLLNEEYDDFSNEERKMMIKQILTSTESTFQLLDNLLAWAKTQLGRTNFSPEYFDIDSLIFETINLSLPQAKMKEVTLKAQVADKNKVFADINMMRTILRNLISNAIKYSYDKGTIVVETLRKNDKMIVNVIDSGTGIEANTLKALFSLDEKVCSKKGTANEKGTGLGLILCKEFVERNHGKISVESELGSGTKFSFTVPLTSY